MVSRPERGSNMEKEHSQDQDYELEKQELFEALEDIQPQKESDHEEQVPLAHEDEENCIYLIYTLQQQEIVDALRIARVFKSVGVGQWVRTALMVVVMAITIYNITIDPNYIGMGAFLITLCVLIILAIWLVPALGIRSQAKQAFDGQPIQVRLFPDRIEAGKVDGDSMGMVSLERATRIEHDKNLYLFWMDDRNLLILPERAFPEESKEEIGRRLARGRDSF